METKASYVLVGAFTLLAIAFGLGFFIWLAKVQVDRVYTQYDITFDSASGLGQSSTVRFNGIDVGKVLTIALDKADPSKVRVRIEVSATTPVRQGTEATLASQGVTGVAFVGLTGGDAGAKRLTIDPATGVAEIPSKPTVVQGLLADAPDMLATAISALDDVRLFSTPANAAHVASILSNLDSATVRLNAMVDDLTKTSASLSKAADQLSGLTTTAGATLDDTRKSLASIDDFAANGLPEFTSVATHANKVLSQVSGLIAVIQKHPTGFLLGINK